MAATAAVPTDMENRSPLLQHRVLLLQELRFFEWLPLRDVVCLLATCATLHRDAATATRLLRRDPYVYDWAPSNQESWCAVPRLMKDWELRDYDDPPPPNRHDVGTIAARRSDDSVWTQTPSDFMADRPDRRTKLLSLVGLMAKEVVPLCYTDCTTSAVRFHAVPFLYPLHLPHGCSDDALKTALNRLYAGLGDVVFTQNESTRPIAIHWDNMTTDSETTNSIVQCNFCDAVQCEVAKYTSEGEAYWARRPQLLREAEQALTDEGIDWDDSDNDAYPEAALEDMDNRYDHTLVHGTRNYRTMRIIEMLHQRRETPFLDALGIVYKDGYEEQVIEEASCSVGKPWGVCDKVLQPLRSFFDKNGFHSVRRVFFPSTAYTGDWGIARVDWIGGVSPGGFVAGVYVVEHSP